MAELVLRLFGPPQIECDGSAVTLGRRKALALLAYLAVALLVIVPVLYLVTLAQELVFGDPTEYTFVANILGIAHPPGYPLYVLVGRFLRSSMAAQWGWVSKC